MSLQVWLPLNGNLNNQGCSDLNLTLASGNEFITEGKIGNSSLKLTKRQIISTTIFNGKKQISFAYWVKVNEAWTTDWLDGFYWITTPGSGTSANRQEFYTNCTKCGMWYAGGSISGYNFTPGIWTHLAGTVNYETGDAAFYINGILQNKKTNVNTEHSITNVYIGDSGINVCECDVRIYDHYLSAAEVKEISQGLVLHYKLDSFQGMRGNANLLKSIPKSYNSSAYCAYQLNFTENLVANQTYTLQLWDVNVAHSAKSAANLGIAFYWGGGSVQLTYPKGTSYFTDGHADYIKVSFTPTEANASHSNAANLWFNVYNSPSNANGTRSMSIGRWKLEKGSSATPWQDSDDILNIIQDDSGYSHNGSILNTVSISSDTPRYSSSVNLPDASSKINCGRGGMVTDSITVSFWCKYNSFSNPVSCTESGGWNIESNGGSLTFPVYITSVGYVHSKNGTNAETLPPANYAGAWHMFTGTYNKQDKTVNLYIDGELKQQNVASAGNDIKYHASNSIWIGAEATSSATTSSNGMAGLFSDFRIYATALSADDILSLYHTSAKVDNKQNLHSFELVESNSAIQINKRGQVLCNELEEDTATKFYKTNQIIETNEIIEL